jgi:hypothetical protein
MLFILTLLLEQIAQLCEILDDRSISFFLLVEHFRVVKVFDEALPALQSSIC